MVIIEENETINTCECPAKNYTYYCRMKNCLPLGIIQLGVVIYKNWITTLSKCEREFIETDFCPKCQ